MNFLADQFQKNGLLKEKSHSTVYLNYHFEERKIITVHLYSSTIPSYVLLHCLNIAGEETEWDGYITTGVYSLIEPP